MLSLRALLAAAVALLALLASPARAGLPSTINDLQRCQAYAQQLQAGQVPADACQPDTLATVKRCIATAVQFGAVSQTDANALIANLDAYCAQQG